MAPTIAASPPSVKEKFKVVLLGEGCVGKTSLVLRYVQNVFRENHVATVQASFLQKRLTLQGQRLELNIWDTAGQETYHALGPIYYRDAQGALLVYDITDEDSYARIQEWIKELRSVLGPIPMVLVGNKCDLDRQQGRPSRDGMSNSIPQQPPAPGERQRVITQEQVQGYARDLNQKMPTIPREQGDPLEMVTWIETSAKLDWNVETAFVELAKRMLAVRNQTQASSGGTRSSSSDRLSKSGVAATLSTSSSPRRSLVILDDRRTATGGTPVRASHSRLAGAEDKERSCCTIS